MKSGEFSEIVLETLAVVECPVRRSNLIEEASNQIVYEINESPVSSEEYRQFQLNLVRSRVSRFLKKLESRKLISSTKKGVVITEKGRQFISDVSKTSRLLRNESRYCSL